MHNDIFESKHCSKHHVDRLEKELEDKSLLLTETCTRLEAKISLNSSLTKKLEYSEERVTSLTKEIGLLNTGYRKEIHKLNLEKKNLTSICDQLKLFINKLNPVSSEYSRIKLNTANHRRITDSLKRESQFSKLSQILTGITSTLTKAHTLASLYQQRALNISNIYMFLEDQNSSLSGGQTIRRLRLCLQKVLQFTEEINSILKYAKALCITILNELNNTFDCSFTRLSDKIQLIKDLILVSLFSFEVRFKLLGKYSEVFCDFEIKLIEEYKAPGVSKNINIQSYLKSKETATLKLKEVLSHVSSLIKKAAIVLQANKSKLFKQIYLGFEDISDDNTSNLLIRVSEDYITGSCLRTSSIPPELNLSTLTHLVLYNLSDFKSVIESSLSSFKEFSENQNAFYQTCIIYFNFVKTDKSHNNLAMFASSDYYNTIKDFVNHMSSFLEKCFSIDFIETFGSKIWSLESKPVLVFDPYIGVSLYSQTTQYKNRLNSFFEMANSEQGLDYKESVNFKDKVNFRTFYGSKFFQEKELYIDKISQLEDENSRLKLEAECKKLDCYIITEHKSLASKIEASEYDNELLQYAKPSISKESSQIEEYIKYNSNLSNHIGKKLLENAVTRSASEDRQIKELKIQLKNITDEVARKSVLITELEYQLVSEKDINAGYKLQVSCN